MSTSSNNEQQVLKRDGEGRKDTGGGEGSSSETNCVGQSCMSKMLCDKERRCVTKMVCMHACIYVCM